jgi:Na+/proline symporter
LSTLDWLVLCGTLAAFVAYGNWRGRGNRDLTGYLLADRRMPWPVVALSVMATQASAVTFLSTPGQGYADGLRFVQFYFGLPLAMIVLCASAVPAYHRMRVFTAYEYLEGRFDSKTRTLAAALFLVLRGLSAGLTIYAPALVLSVLLGWDVRWTCVLLGALVVLGITSGGSRAVTHAHFLQFLVIMGTMGLAFALIVRSLPAGVGLSGAAAIAGRLGRLHAVTTAFDPNDRYNLWSGLIGGFFLQLSYFGADQSQVGRYLTGSSLSQSRLGLLFNGLMKVPMQFFILFLGVMVFAFYQFHAPPVYFDPVATSRIAAGRDAAEFSEIESRHRAAFEAMEPAVARLAAAIRAGDERGAAAAEGAVREYRAEMERLRGRTLELVRGGDPRVPASDTNYIFLTFVLHHLPAGIIGLVLAAVFAASMNSSSAEVNALTSTTVVDVYRRLRARAGKEPAHAPRRELRVSRLATLLWAAFAVAFAEYAARLGSLIEAVNILGSLFYGTILGIFLTGFFLRRVRGTAVFWAAIVGEAAVVACFTATRISFLWYNLVGCAVVMAVALALSAIPERRRTPSAA